MPLHRNGESTISWHHDGLIGLPRASPTGGGVGHEGVDNTILWIYDIGFHQQASGLRISVLQLNLQLDQAEWIVERLVRLHMVDGNARRNRARELQIKTGITKLTKSQSEGLGDVTLRSRRQACASSSNGVEAITTV